MKHSLRVLLEHLIDYAGLFPPAALSMEDAVRNYARYREGEHAFALGKFVVPAARAHEVPSNFPLSILGIDEVKEIEGAAPGAFVESTDLDAIARAGLRAKIRTGGVTPDAFPSTESVAQFIRACKEKGIAFKATAGLHHPVRCVKPLTYEPDAPTGTMHGFLNVFLAALFVDDTEEILRETDPRAFVFTDEGVRWRDHFASTDEIARMRRDFAMSFGSCSFEEPIEDLKELRFL
ncbi:MAG TPA: hypothetical protein VMU84_19195 [Thermoanaerobaculia bacterium]|nr:hypothetical protein [Thermoanaerobaculia bacterium]